MKLLFIMILAGSGLWAKDPDEEYLKRYQSLQSQTRILVKEWSADCRRRVAGGVLQQQGDFISCVVPSPPQPAAPTQLGPVQPAAPPPVPPSSIATPPGPPINSQPATGDAKPK